MRLAPRFIFLQAIILVIAGTILLFSIFASARVVGVVLLVGGMIGIVVGRAAAWEAGQFVGEAVREITTRATLRIRKVNPKAFLVVVAGVSGRDRFPLYGTTPIGRDRRVSELLFHTEEERSPISGLHCTIIDAGGEFKIRDEGSSNGTFVNGVQIEEDEPLLRDGDEIELAPVERGGIRLRFQIAEPGNASKHTDSSQS